MVLQLKLLNMWLGWTSVVVHVMGLQVQLRNKLKPNN
jgi:hypothetical protein